jgi:3-phytase
LFVATGFTEDIEGISIYKFDDGTGYILVSDQQASKFRIFPRDGSKDNAHAHPEVKFVTLQMVESGSSDVTSRSLPAFRTGSL